jgi:hypothetical protein
MIRRATVNDLDAMLMLGRRAHAASRYRDIKIDELQAKTNLLAMMHNRAQCVFLAFEGERLVGLLLGIEVPWFFSREPYATDLMTYAVRVGAGRALIRRFKKWAFEERKLPGIELSTSFGGTEEQRARTEGLYRAMGFEPVGSYFAMRRPKPAVQQQKEAA